MRTDVPPQLSAAMASGQYQACFEVSVWDDRDVFQGSTPHVYDFKIEPLQLEVTIPMDVFDTWAIGYKVAIARGAIINGSPSTISTSRFQIRELEWGDMKTNIR